MRDGHLLPSLFVLLPNKTEATYRRMWDQIRLLCPLAQPREMLLDFEKAAINSFEEMWPDTLVKCFHLTQNVWRKVQGAGLQAAYSQDEELAMRIRQLPALAFAPLQDVPGLFAAVAALLPMPEATELVLYFERGLVEVRQAKFTAGAAPTKRSSAQANEQALVNLVASYYDRTGVEYLRGVAHHFSFGAD